MTMVVNSHLSQHSSIEKSVEDYKSQFIKEGLKMKVKKNLKIESEDSLQKILNLNIKQENEVKSLQFLSTEKNFFTSKNLFRKYSLI